jgi:predicted lipoprotein with Yx(FWY)xxD motif
MRNTTSLLCAALAAALLTACGPDPEDDLAPGAVNEYPDGANVASESDPLGAQADGRRIDPAPGSTVDALAGNDTAGAQRPAELGDAPLAMAGEGDGAYLTNSAGSALYYVEGDQDGSACTGDCLRAWPPMLVGDTMPSSSAGLQAGMIGTVTRPDGQRQVTYNGHPLYRYAADTGDGEAAGNGVQDQWGQWHLIGPGGEPVVQAADASATEGGSAQ